MQHVNTESDAVDAFKVLDESGGGAISRLVVVGQFWIVCKHQEHILRNANRISKTLVLFCRQEFKAFSSEDFDRFDLDNSRTLDMPEFEALWFYNPRPPGTDYCRDCLNYDEYAKIRLAPTANGGSRAKMIVLLSSLSLVLTITVCFN